jgi:hypothetical protein
VSGEHARRQGYNAVFARAGALFIEVAPGLPTADGGYLSVARLAGSLRLRVFLIPVPGVAHRAVDSTAQLLVCFPGRRSHPGAAPVLRVLLLLCGARFPRRVVLVSVAVGAVLGRCAFGAVS